MLALASCELVKVFALKAWNSDKNDSLENVHSYRVARVVDNIDHWSIIDFFA